MLVDLKVWCCEDELSTLYDVHQETIRIASQIDDSNFLWRQNVCVSCFTVRRLQSHINDPMGKKSARARLTIFGFESEKN